MGSREAQRKMARPEGWAILRVQRASPLDNRDIFYLCPGNDGPEGVLWVGAGRTFLNRSK